MRLKGLRAVILGLAMLSAGSLTLAAQGRAAPRSSASAQREQGRRVFLQYCAACHGESGNGKPASGLTLRPPALDFTSFELSPSFIRQVLQQGVPGTGMAAWKSLPPDQLSAVVVYTTGLGRRPDQLHAQERVASDKVLRESGRRVYVAHCERCHGNEGQGDGPEASRYKPPPAPFTEMRPSYTAAAWVMEKGVPGTAMPAWPLLTRAEVQAVSFYVRSLYRGPKRPIMAPHASRASSGRP